MLIINYYAFFLLTLFYARYCRLIMLIINVCIEWWLRTYRQILTQIERSDKHEKS